MKARVLVAVFIIIAGAAGLYFAFQKSSVHLSPDSDIPAANNNFAFRLFDKMTDESQGDNVFISPVSISLALSMTLNGAEGSTKKSMLDALGLADIPLDTINRDNTDLMRSLLSADPKVKLSIANSLWLRDGISFKREFLSRTRKSYNAEITNLDYTSRNALDKVNNWVNKATNGKINNIVNAGDFADSVLMLVNAIYFNGKWSEPFEDSNTKDRDFHLPDDIKTVKMMNQSGEYLYTENPDFQAISLPYGDERFSMYIFLPSENTGLDAFLAKLDAGNWNKWTSAMTKREGSISLPKFKIEYDVELTSVLKSLGMSDAFLPSANFSGMTDESVFISYVIHKSYLEVDEEGTEAAAATVVVMGKAAMPIAPTEKFEMIVDRPFFIAIHDNETGTILFMGSIMNP
ncbi:MAG: serpin family protein [Armatimonadota bacterium]